MIWSFVVLGAERVVFLEAMNIYEPFGLQSWGLFGDCNFIFCDGLLGQPGSCPLARQGTWICLLSLCLFNFVRLFQMLGKQSPSPFRLRDTRRRKHDKHGWSPLTFEIHWNSFTIACWGCCGFWVSISVFCSSFWLASRASEPPSHCLHVLSQKQRCIQFFVSYRLRIYRMLYVTRRPQPRPVAA